jgi:hypothetical protein
MWPGVVPGPGTGREEARKKEKRMTKSVKEMFEPVYRELLAFMAADDQEQAAIEALKENIQEAFRLTRIRAAELAAMLHGAAVMAASESDSDQFREAERLANELQEMLRAAENWQ